MTESTTLYRKYRPKKFAEAVGQQDTIDSLKHWLTNWDNPKVSRPHAMIFQGPRGCGKTTLARLFAAALNCQNLSEDCEPCGECNTCRGVIEGTSTVGLEEIDAAQKSGVGDMQELIQSLNIASLAKVKVILIDEVHLLTHQGQSKLLKTLEEPPPNVLFIFATTDPDKLKEATLSRLSKVQIRMMGPDVIESLVARVVKAEGREISEDNLAGIVALADGSAREALSRLESVLAGHNITIGQWAHRITAAVGEDNVSEVLFTLTEALNDGEDLQSITGEIITHWNNCLMAQQAPRLIERLPRVMLEAAQADAALIRPPKLLRLLDSLIEARGKLHQTSDSLLLIQSALVQVLVPEANRGIDGLHARLDQIEDRLMARLDELEEHVRTIVATAPAPAPAALQQAPAPVSTAAIEQAFQLPARMHPQERWPGVDAEETEVNVPSVPAEATRILQETRVEVATEIDAVDYVVSDAAETDNADLDVDEIRDWMIQQASRRTETRLSDTGTVIRVQGSVVTIEVAEDEIPIKVRNEVSGMLSGRGLTARMITVNEAGSSE